MLSCERTGALEHEHMNDANLLLVVCVCYGKGLQVERCNVIKNDDDEGVHVGVGKLFIRDDIFPWGSLSLVSRL